MGTVLLWLRCRARAFPSLPFRLLRRLGLAALALAVVSCGGSNANGGGLTNPPPAGAQTGDVVVNIQGTTGNEIDPGVRWVIGDAPIPRSAAPDSNLSPACDVTGSSGSCDITVDTGKVVTIYAIEVGPGGIDMNHSTERPYFPPDGHTYEFIDWTGPCGPNTVGFGNCAVSVTKPQTYQVTVRYQLMQVVEFDQVGWGYFCVTAATVRPLLSFVDPEEAPSLGCPNGGPFRGPDPEPSTEAWFPAGSKITLEAVGSGSAKFLRWDGDCTQGGTGSIPECTLVIPDTVATAYSFPIREATAHIQYWQCGNVVGNAPGPGCTLVNP